MTDQVLEKLIDIAEIERRKQGKVAHVPKPVKFYDRWIYWWFFYRWSALLSDNPQIGIGIAHKLLDHYKKKRKS